MVNSATIGQIKVFFGIFLPQEKNNILQYDVFFPPIFRHVEIWCSTIHLLLKDHRRVIRIYMYITALIFNNQSADHEDTYCLLLCVWMCVCCR